MSFTFDAGQESNALCEGDKAMTYEAIQDWHLEDFTVKDAKTSYDLNDFSTDIALETDGSDYDSLLKWVMSVLCSSPTARYMLKEAMDQGWEISLDVCEGYDFHLDVPEKLIVLDHQGLSAQALARSDHFRSEILWSFTRALRDVWQEKRHGAFDELYAPEHILMLERVRAADCDVLAVLVAWELRSAGHGQLWRHLLGSDQNDVALAFGGAIDHKPFQMATKFALQAAFKQWYRDEARVNKSDHETLNYMDSVMEDLGTDGNPFGRDKATPGRIEILSCLPDKTAYLQGMGSEISRDPFYAGLSDPINQSHISQIVYDTQVVYVQNVPFRDVALADKIFPNGQFSEEIA